MTFWLVLDNKINSLATGEFCPARLLGIEMIEASLAGKNLPVFSQL